MNQRLVGRIGLRSLAFAAGLVVLAGLGLTRGQAQGPTPGPGPTPTTNAEPTRDALPTTSAEPPPTTGTTAGEQLLAILPADVDPGQPAVAVKRSVHRSLIPAAEEIDDPLLRVMEKLRKHFEVIRAVRFAYQGE